MNDWNQTQGGGVEPKSGGGAKILIGLIVALVAIAGIGTYVVKKLFNYGMEKAIEAASGVSINQEGGTLTFKGKDGTSVVVTGKAGEGNVSVKGAGGKEEFSLNAGDGASLPAGFPEDFPVIAGAKTTAATRMSQGRDTIFNIVWETGQDFKQSAGYYSSQMPGKGWKTVSSVQTDEASSIVFERGGGNGKENAVVAVKKNDAGSQVALMLKVSSK